MYARVLRKWSRKAKHLSSMWLAVVTSIMLLLFVCAPASAAALSAPASAYSSAKLLPARAAALSVRPATAKATFSAATLHRSPFIIPAAEADITARANAGVAEESFYIPVASQADSNSANVANNIYSKRLINALSSSNRSSTSISSIASRKIISSSRLISSSNSNSYQQHAPVGPATQAKNLAYAFYYRSPPQLTPAEASMSASATVFDNLKQQHQQQHLVSNVHDYNEQQADEDDDEEEGDELVDDDNDATEDADVDVDTDTDAEEYENEKEPADMAKSAADNDSAAMLPASVVATAKAEAVYKQKVPHVENSQIINLFNINSPNQISEQRNLNQQQLRQQQASTSNVRNTKARRHVQDHSHQQKQQQQYSHQPHAIPASQNYHSPVRETGVVRGEAELAVPAAGTATSHTAAAPALNATALPRFRYFIEAYEVPASLPYTGELTEQQQQLAARSRRDSRVFGLKQSLGASAVGYQQHYYTSQQQQQQQQQQPQSFQRLQQYQNTNAQHMHKQQQQQQQRELQQHQQQHRLQQRQRQHQHRQRQTHRRRYCSARDPAQLAFEAPTVIEGRIVSMTPDRRANFSATFKVKRIFKQQLNYQLPDYLRLQFAYRNSSGECDIYREQLKPRGLVRGDELDQGRSYLVFVQQVDVSNFTILGQPIRKTRRVVDVVEETVSANYAQLASIESIKASNLTVERGKKLSIICRVRGKPPPKVTWFKDGKSIKRNRNLYQFGHYKKRSELIIRSFNLSDAGRYECRAKNKANRNLERRAIVIKAYKVSEPRFETHLTDHTGHSCPGNLSEYCFHGGTCNFFTELSTYSCTCPEGFIGERCDLKEINGMPPSTYNTKQECGEKKYYGDSMYKTGYMADDPFAEASLELPLNSSSKALTDS